MVRRMQLPDSSAMLDLVLLAGTQAAACAVLALAIHLLIRVTTDWLGRALWSSVAERLAPLRRRACRTVWIAAGAALLACLGVDALVWWRHGDVWGFWNSLAARVPGETWQALGWALLRIAGAAVLAILAGRILRGLLAAAERRIHAWGRLRAEPAELRTWLACVDRGLRDALWLGVAVFAAQQAQLPAAAVAVLIDGVLIFLAIAIGRCAGRASAAVIATIDALGADWTNRRGWQEWYARLRPLAPLLRRCLDYILWVAVASFVLTRLGPVSGLAQWGPRLIQAIGLFFLARAGVELFNLLIELRLLRQPDGADASAEALAARQRRATFAPLARSAGQIAIWVLAGVLALSALGIDTTPIIAGIGALGLVIGLGARSLIEDITVGICIVYEGTFLVGDFIEVDGGKGTVEAIGFRTTRFRDLEGRVHLVRNGGLRTVINYSKDFTNAVVRVEVGYGAHLPTALAAMAEAGRRTRAELGALVLADAELTAIEAFNASGMTLRALMRCAPAKHWTAAAAFRTHLRACFAEAGVPLASPRQEVVLRGGEAAIQPA